MVKDISSMIIILIRSYCLVFIKYFEYFNEQRKTIKNKYTLNSSIQYSIELTLEAILFDLNCCVRFGI